MSAGPPAERTGREMRGGEVRSREARSREARALPGRRRLLTGGAALGLLGALSACAGEQQQKARERWAALGERPDKYGAEPRTLPASITPEDRRGLESSVGRHVLTGTERRADLEPLDAASILNEDEPPDEPVTAPEGEEFLLFTLDAVQLVWRLPDTVPLPRARCVVRRPGGEEGFPLDLRQASGTWIVRVAADAAPQDAVLEVVELGRTQRLSLIDGSLVHTDVPHLYGRTRVTGTSWPGGGVEAFGKQAPEADGEEAEDAHGNRDRISLLAKAVRDMPLSRSLGWAADGEQLLRLTVDAWHRVFRPDSGASVLLPLDLTGSVLRLPDGTERQPAEVMDARHQPELGGLRGTVLLTFSVPVDLTSAEVRLAAIPFPRREGLADQLAASCAMTVPLTLEPPS